MTAVDEDLIHTWQKGTVLRRYNRSSNKCRGNFFPSGPKETPGSDRVLFPEPAHHPVGAALRLYPSGRVRAHRPAYLRTTQFPDRAILRAKGCAGPALRCKEGLRQLDRKLPRHFRANGFSETGPDRSGLVWRHFLARVRARHPKYRWP